MTPEQQQVDEAVRRTVGFAALRRLRRLVDEENAQERRQARWALLIGIAFSMGFAIFLGWLLDRSL